MKMLRRCAAVAWLVPLLMTVACTRVHRRSTPLATVQTALQASPEMARHGYLLQVGDQIAVKFYHNPELNEEETIRPDGMISLQLIGDVQAAGLSPIDLSAELARRYTGELAAPKITVIVRTLGSSQVFVGGEVSRPGVIPLTNGLTLAQAIQEAGGLLKTAHRKQIVLIRRESSGRPTGHIIDIRPILSGEHPEADVPLHASDVVVVPTSKIADVDIFVEQYFRNVLPFTPAVPLL
jgi:protein involved in polysaccharide export with SLBB domain